MKFLKDFIILLKARYPIIYVSTFEEERIEYLLKYSAKKYISRICYVWNFVEGYQGNPNNNGFATDATNFLTCQLIILKGEE